MTTLSRTDLHESLNDPVMSLMSFLNEIMGRHPGAISFAPGAPYPYFFDDLDVSKAIDRYVDHLNKEKGFTLAQARRQIYQYGPVKGQINDFVARSLKDDQCLEVAPAGIVITVGCQEGILLALRALFASPKDILVAVNPSFVGIAGAARILDIKAVGLDEIDSGVDFKKLRTMCKSARRDGKRTRALYVAPNFSNPSGNFIDLAARRELLKVANEEDFLILEDDAYGFTAEETAALPSLKVLDENNRVIYLGTFSKICLPGVRVGFVVADQTVELPSGQTRLLADELAAIKSMITNNTSTVCQAIIAGMLIERQGSMAAVGRDKSEIYRRNLKLLLEGLERHVGKGKNERAITWSAPRGGFFVGMRLPVVADGELLELSAREYGVLWTPMSGFYLGDAGKNQIRLSCSYLTPELIEEGVGRLAQFLQDERVVGQATSAPTSKAAAAS